METPREGLKHQCLNPYLCSYKHRASNPDMGWGWPEFKESQQIGFIIPIKNNFPDFPIIIICLLIRT